MSEYIYQPPLSSNILLKSLKMYFLKEAYKRIKGERGLSLDYRKKISGNFHQRIRKAEKQADVRAAQEVAGVRRD